MRPDIDTCNDIEILRQECRRLSSVIDQFIRDEKNYTDLHEALKAENERLREALKRIAWLPSNHGTTFKKLIRCQEIAHEALDETISKCGG